MKILMAASEMAPFVKVGGLADVVGSLPMALAALGHDVRVVIPLYKVIPEIYKEQMTTECVFELQMGWRRQYCGLLSMPWKGITVYFVDNQYYFGWDRVYGYMEEEAERFSFFDRAVLEIIQRIGFYPDILHCHDWQAGMIPVLLRTQYAWGDYMNIKSVMTIHNLKYQGVFDNQRISDLLGLHASLITDDKLEFFGAVSFLKGGIVYAHKVTTVSPSYAIETCDPFLGERLDGVLRSRSSDYIGILNGIDVEEWDPASDSHIIHPYTKDQLRNKVINKKALQTELWLDQEAETPLIGMVTRLVAQKGLDLLRHVLQELLYRQPKLQLVALGTGDYEYEDFFRHVNANFPGRVSSILYFDNELAHRIYAGSDMLLVPSAFEPCGLTQMIALRYGTLPVVRETGGLKDTVRSYDEATRKGNGFSFSAYNAHDMMYTIERAVGIYQNKRSWNAIVRNAMQEDFSWIKSADAYMALYEQAISQ